MKLDDFRSSLEGSEPAEDLHSSLKAMWWDGKGDWDKAHEIVQTEESDPQNAWVHAYLHRKEVDLANAAYWYRRAGKPVANGSLEEEWETIVAQTMLSEQGISSLGSIFSSDQ